jgi:hypothetical protein
MKTAERMNVKPAAKASIKLIEGESNIIKAFDSIKRRGVSLQRELHIAACSVLAHVGKHKDIRLVTRALESVPDMVRGNALRSWFDAFAPVTFDKGKAKYDSSKQVRLADAMGKPFWSFKAKEGTEYESPNFAKLIESLVKRLETDQLKVGSNHADAIAMLNELATAYELAEPSETEESTESETVPPIPAEPVSETATAETAQAA